MSATDDRAQEVVTFLAKQRGRYATIDEIAVGIGCGIGQTRRAIARARDALAGTNTSVGFAVYHNGYTYTLTGSWRRLAPGLRVRDRSITTQTKTVVTQLETIAANERNSEQHRLVAQAAADITRASENLRRAAMTPME